jgi:hypothetical protein
MPGLILLKDFQVYGTEFFNPVMNVYGYKSTLAVVDELNAFLDRWIAEMLPKVIGIQQNSMFHYQLEAYMLNTTGFVARTLSSGNQGQRSGSIPDRFTAWGFRYNRASVGQRSGAKRIGFVSENDYSGATPSGAAASLIADCATQMQAPLMEGIVQTWFPVVLHRPPNPSGTWTSHDISGVVFTEVTTQNSRKR